MTAPAAPLRVPSERLTHEWFPHNVARNLGPLTFLRGRENRMIPTIRFQILKYSRGNYVQLFWGELTKGQHEAGAEQHKLGTTGGTTRGQAHRHPPAHQLIHQASHGLVTLTRSSARQVAALTRRCAAGPDRWSMGNPAHTATQGVNLRIQGPKHPPIRPKPPQPTHPPSQPRPRDTHAQLGPTGGSTNPTMRSWARQVEHGQPRPHRHPRG